MTRSDSIALRQQKALDYHFGEVSGLVCTVLLPSHPKGWFETRMACQPYETTRRLALVTWTHCPVSDLVESAGTPRQLTIAIATHLSHTVHVFPRFPPLGLV